jgi:hypothetical protein
MVCLAVESGVNEYASAWFHRNFGKNETQAMQFLESSMDFRKIVRLLWFVGVFTDELKRDLNWVYDGRRKYAHIQTLEIAGKIGEEEIEERTSDGKTRRRFKVKDDEVSRLDAVLMNAQEDAWEMIRKTEYCLVRLFKKDESDYWRKLVWNLKD